MKIQIIIKYIRSVIKKISDVRHIKRKLRFDHIMRILRRFFRSDE